MKSAPLLLIINLLYAFVVIPLQAQTATQLWVTRYNGPANGDDEPIAVVVDSAGNIIVTGFSNNATETKSDYYTAKYDAVDGHLVWEQRYTGISDGDNVARAIAVDDLGNVVVTGSSANTMGTTDYYTAKYDANDGHVVWEQRYNGLINGFDGFDSASAVALDADGNAVVTGSSEGFTGPNYYTAKYASVDGHVVWSQRYIGAAGSNHIATATALAVDESFGSVAVTGYSQNINGDLDYYTAKYAGDDGHLLWEQSYNGPADGDDKAAAVAIDGLGNVVVTGYSNDANTVSDFYTAKYASDDGHLLWEQRYNGPNNSDDKATAVAVDGSGNVVVTGYSSGANKDYYTAKYDTTDGHLLWEKRYDGPDGGEDYTTAVAVDGSGNVVVTGSSYSAFSANSADYYTAEYAAADGSLLWEKRYDGPANSYDFVEGPSSLLKYPPMEFPRGGSPRTYV